MENTTMSGGGSVSSTSWTGRVRRALGSRYSRHMNRWENQLAGRATDRTVREFEWGLDWTREWPCAGSIPLDGHDPATYLTALNEAIVQNSGDYFSYRTPSDFRLQDNQLGFTSAVTTPWPENNTVYGQWFPARTGCRRAVIVLPHWNAKLQQHVSLCRALRLLGIATLRISLPYHDLRMPAGMTRADFAVSSNIARTVDAARQAVIDTRSCVDWLETQGYEKFGIVGTSLGSCYAFLASAHEPRLQANVFNLFSLQFADVVWTGLTTRHIRQGLDGCIELEQLRRAWKAITPLSYVDHYARYEKRSLFIYGTYDTTFLPMYSKSMIDAVRERRIHHTVKVLPCGHYTLGEAPFKFLDGYHICSFLLKSL
jgi:hypothetical protein